MAARRYQTDLSTLLSADSLTSTRTVDGDEPPRTALLDEIAPHPDNPRDDLDIDEMADTLRELGQIHAAVVVSRTAFLEHHPHHADAIGTARWVVISGNRRLAAARKAGWTTLKIEVQDNLASSGDSTDEALMIANIHQQNLPPLREAEFLAKLVQRHGSQRKVARRLGKSQGWISQRIALLTDLTPKLQAALRAGELNVSAARDLATWPRDEQLRVWKSGPPYAPYVEPQPEREPAPSAPSDYAVITPEPAAPNLAPVGASDYGVITAEPHAAGEPERDQDVPAGAAERERVIRVSATSIPELADALRDQLTGDELRELVMVLS